MGQVTLYLDTKTETKMKVAAKAAGISLSRWVADLIRAQTADEWPASVANLAGAWSEMPSLDEIRSSEGEDIERESL